MYDSNCYLKSVQINNLLLLIQQFLILLFNTYQFKKISINDGCLSQGFVDILRKRYLLND